jgi:hypothetical protein
MLYSRSIGKLLPLFDDCFTVILSYVLLSFLPRLFASPGGKVNLFRYYYILKLFFQNQNQIIPGFSLTHLTCYLMFFSVIPQNPLPKSLNNNSWGEEDSNLRRHTPADLQSAPVGHFGISPGTSRWRDSNPRPADYKSAALAN